MNFNFRLTLSNLACMVSLILGSCQQDCHKTGTCSPKYYRLELGEAKDYICAGVGSYWIYRNTKTGELDTQTCIGAKTFWGQSKGTQTYTKNITIDFERLVLQKYSSYNKWTYYFNTVALKADDAAFDGENRVILDCQVASEGINTSFFHPFIVGAASWSGSSDMHCRNNDTIIQIGNITYSKVVKFEIDIDEIWEDKMRCVRPNTVYYWVKNIGLIKKEMRRCNYSWELIEYKILP